MLYNTIYQFPRTSTANYIFYGQVAVSTNYRMTEKFRKVMSSNIPVCAEAVSL